MVSSEKVPGGDCLEIDGVMKCLNMNPTPEKNCTMLNNIAFCENGKKPTTFREERNEFFGIVFNPRLRKSETKQIERNFVQFTIGLVLSALVFTLSLFITDIVRIIASYFLPSSTTILSLFIIIVVLIGISLVLAFVQTRVSTALEETELLEKIAEKDPAQALQAVIE